MIVVIKDLYTLKSWEDQDTESLAFHLNNKKIWDNCRDGLPYPYTKGNARFFIKQAQEKTDISDFCITVGGEAIGNIGFVRGTDVERFNAEVGYWISEKYWNQGIVSDALTEAIQYYFAHTEVIRIFATVYEYNPASMRVLEKAGFRKTGIFRKACYKNGQLIDAHHFELVDVEYVKEGSDWYLRVYIDKEGGITVDDCEAVSRAFSDKLDENDFIEDSYIMEISSPGLDRPLKKDKDFERNMGKLVEIRTYRPIEKQKEFCGILTAYDSNSVTIDEDGTERTFDKKDIALIRLAIEF